MKRNFFTLMVAMLATLTAVAQSFTGQVVDETQNPIPFANVVLLNASDSAFVAGTTTDGDGVFTLTGQTSNPLVKITFLGYKTRVIGGVSADLGIIALEPEATELGEVVVKAQRPAFKLTTEGLKTEVENTLLSKVGTAKAVLENLPGVQRKKDGLEVFGKGTPLIYINGRKLQIQTELDQISSEDIQSVELITSPGAKYDATVESVILIKTKRPQGEGFSFNTQASYCVGKGPDTTLGLNWNYRHKGLDVFGSVWYNDYKWIENDDFSFEVNADTLWHMEEQSDIKSHSNLLYTSVGLNYIFNDNHSTGFKYDTQANFLNRTRGTFTADVMADGAFYDHLDNKIHMSSKSNMPHTLNAYYNGKVGKTSIDFNTDYVFNKDRKSQFNDEVSQQWDSRTVTSTNVVRNQLWASKLVLSWSLWGGNLQVGSEYDHTRRNDDYINPEQVVPTSYSEQRERNVIFFAEYAHPLPFGQLKAGLRNENVTSDYYDRGVRMADQSRKYHHFFPNVGLMARAGQVQLMLNYAMKIKRPYYWELRNSVTYANRFTWDAGNPYLKPTINNEVSLMAIYKWVNLMLAYKHDRDVNVNVAHAVPGSEATTLMNKENVDDEDAMRVMITFSPRWDFYQPSLTLGMIKDWIKIPSPIGFISPKDPIWLIQFDNNFQIMPTLTANVNFSFTSSGDMQNVTLVKPANVLNIGATKTFLNDRLSIQVTGHNLLNSQEHVKLSYGLRTMCQTQRRDTREVEFTVRYKFNAAQSKYKGTGAGSSEKERFGN
ncbi:MAG: outer membrane beta-barrel protein [Muribaculaceae bacterium]|nr:outer membrane beta-barrel protein [Muribaculaceae bacterium]MBR1941663.1 outer membrane beta-barrel protein [Bacteroidaceae bacterium]